MVDYFDNYLNQYIGVVSRIMLISEFTLFGALHLKVIGICLLVWILVPILGNKLRGTAGQTCLRVIIACLFLIWEFGDDLRLILIDDFYLAVDLPLHLCGIAMLLSAYTLFTLKQDTFELLYFWGLGGAIQAILTPDLNADTTNFEFFLTFNNHGLIVTAVLWMIFVEKMRQRKGSLLRTILITNILLAMIAGINVLIPGANYFFICWKPGAQSPFFIGEWPWYILSMEVFGIIIMMLLYLPMWWRNRQLSRNT